MPCACGTFKKPVSSMGSVGSLISDKIQLCSALCSGAKQTKNVYFSIKNGLILLRDLGI